MVAMLSLRFAGAHRAGGMEMLGSADLALHNTDSFVSTVNIHRGGGACIEAAARMSIGT